MLSELHIEDLGIIDRLDLVLGAGLTVLTGETGAGKTMLVEAISLLVGGRADAGESGSTPGRDGCRARALGDWEHSCPARPLSRGEGRMPGRGLLFVDHVGHCAIGLDERQHVLGVRGDDIQQIGFLAGEHSFHGRPQVLE